MRADDVQGFNDENKNNKKTTILYIIQPFNLFIIYVHPIPQG